MLLVPEKALLKCRFTGVSRSKPFYVHRAQLTLATRRMAKFFKDVIFGDDPHHIYDGRSSLDKTLNVLQSINDWKKHSNGLTSTLRNTVDYTGYVQKVQPKSLEKIPLQNRTDPIKYARHRYIDLRYYSTNIWLADWQSKGYQEVPTIKLMKIVDPSTDTSGYHCIDQTDLERDIFIKILEPFIQNSILDLEGRYPIKIQLHSHDEGSESVEELSIRDLLWMLYFNWSIDRGYPDYPNQRKTELNIKIEMEPAEGADDLDNWESYQLDPEAPLVLQFKLILNRYFNILRPAPKDAAFIGTYHIVLLKRVDPVFAHGLFKDALDHVLGKGYSRAFDQLFFQYGFF